MLDVKNTILNKTDDITGNKILTLLSDFNDQEIDFLYNLLTAIDNKTAHPPISGAFAKKIMPFFN